jgi:hemolysin activation/secretion protein
MRLTDHWQLLTNVQGQLSGKNLDDSQRFIAGGSQGLRGFSANELLVDQGALIRIDMIKQLNDKWRLGGFIDWARVEKRNNNSNINGTPLEVNNRMNAYNWGLTSTYRSEESLRIDLTLAQALSDTLGVITDQGDVQAMLNLKWTF